MDEYIFYADRLVSVADPYVFDRFVASHHREVLAVDIDKLKAVYSNVSNENRLLTGLLRYLKNINPGKTINVVDIGVFMGSFSIAIDTVALRLGAPIRIDAFEANPMLISSIMKNFLLYGTRANLHWSAIGNKRGSQELVVNKGGAIGGSLANVESRKRGNYFSCNVDTLPLSDALSDDASIGIIKIDIEGHEVAAFSTLSGQINKLNNVFIVEYAPKQGRESVAPGITYNDFILEHFDAYNLGNCGWFRFAQPLRGNDDLVNIDLGNGGSNTDLLLLPKALGIDPNLL